jgi:predicted nucleotidyltransferase
MTVRPEELAATLVARRRRERADAAARAATACAQARVVARALREEGVIEGAWLIGSLAWGEAGARSDADIVVRGCTPSALTGAWRRLGDALDLSVDVLRFEELASSFQSRVLEQGIRVDEP